MNRAEAIRVISGYYAVGIRSGKTQIAKAVDMAIAALRAQQGYSPAEQPPPDRFLAQTKWGKVVLVERRSWGDRDWLVGGLYIPKDIVWWWPLPEPSGGNNQ